MKKKSASPSTPAGADGKVPSPGWLERFIRAVVRLVLIAAITLLVIFGGIAGGAWWATSHFAAPGANTATVRIFIPKKSGLSGSITALTEAGLMPGPLDNWLFAAEIEIKGAAHLLRAGEYDVPAQASLAEIAQMLETGRGLVRHPLTIPEGLTTTAALNIVKAMPVLSGDITVTPAEGALLPETYDVQRDDDRDAVIHRMTTAMDKELALLWAKRDPDVPLTSPHEAVILASIVERETALATERPHIAAVFINRLQKAMPLQSDPTVIYGLSPKTGTLDHPLSRKELTEDTPYNTYTRTGLPAGPIANPGKASLMAVLHPMASDDLYFVADGTGGHAFAATLEEHNRNVAKWRKIQKDKEAAAPAGAAAPSASVTPSAR